MTLLESLKLAQQELKEAEDCLAAQIRSYPDNDSYIDFSSEHRPNFFAVVRAFPRLIEALKWVESVSTLGMGGAVLTAKYVAYQHFAVDFLSKLEGEK